MIKIILMKESSEVFFNTLLAMEEDKDHATLLQTVQIQEKLVYFHSSFVVKHTLVSQIS